MSIKVLVTGIGGPAGRSAASYFRSKGFFVIGTDVRNVDAESDRFLLLPLATDASFSEELLKVMKEERPALFVPTVTEELEKVARHKTEIEALGCEVYISSAGAVRVANDKLATAVFLERNGVPVPETFDGTVARDFIMKELGLPLLAKPCFGRGGRGVAVLRSEEEVRREKRHSIVFQEFIPGDEFDINLFVDKGGEVRAGVALRKTALKEGIVGNAASVERAVRDDLVKVAIRAAEALKLEGPLDFDIRLRADGTPAVLEINARLGGNSLSAPEVLDALTESLLKRTAREKKTNSNKSGKMEKEE